MSFASVSDLATFLGRTIAVGAETTQAQLLLDLATAQMQAYMGQVISAVAGEVIVVDAPLDPTMPIILPESPVTAVSAVSVDGTALVVATDVDWYSTGLVYRRDNRWWSTTGTGRQRVSITYSHGYATIPVDLKDVCLAIAAQRLSGEPGTLVDSEGNPATVSIVQRSGELHQFTEAERDVMDRYRVLAVA